MAGGLGLCGLDPKRSALTGTEMRVCWVAAPPAPDAGDPRRIAVGPGRRSDRDELPGSASGRPPRTFVPVEPVAAVSEGASPADGARAGVTTDGAVGKAATIAAATGAPGRIPGTWWLWGDPEPWPDL